MDKFYLMIDHMNEENIKKLSDKIKSQYASSPKTLRKIISNENFIKYQWPWIL